MNNTVLQIPMTMELREKSEKAAVEAGFSSLQEAVRIFLKKFSHKELVVSFDMPKIKLSEKNEKRYIEMIKDYKKDKSEYRSFDDVDDMMKYLNS
jgi:antitoxin component of RelBE/YafQ-DinJ toxin-antitoxin module